MPDCRSGWLIGLTGSAGSGKDTIADILIDRWDFVRIKVAEPLRAECAWALATGEAPLNAPEDIRHILSLGAAVDVYAKPTSPEARRLLQYWGADYRRAQNQDYWIEKLVDSIIGLTEINLVVTDIRFHNEAQSVIDLSGSIWQVQRPTTLLTGETANHKSEMFCKSDWPWDAVIINDGSLKDLEDKVIRAMTDCYSEKTVYAPAFSAVSLQNP